jgi:hypothetical protein
MRKCLPAPSPEFEDSMDIVLTSGRLRQSQAPCTRHGKIMATMKESKGTTQIGFVNRNGQVVIRNTGGPGTDFGATTYQLGCSVCGKIYGANSTDIFERRCPDDGGKPGLAINPGRH